MNQNILAKFYCLRSIFSNEAQIGEGIDNISGHHFHLSVDYQVEAYGNRTINTAARLSSKRLWYCIFKNHYVDSYPHFLPGLKIKAFMYTLHNVLILNVEKVASAPR